MGNFSSNEIMLMAGVALPLVGFVILALFGSRIGKPMAGWVAVAFMGASCVLSTVVVAKWWGMSHDARVEAAAAAHDHSVPWARFGDVWVHFGVNLDSLTVIMYFMVTFVGFWIFVFSVGYMAGHSDEIDGKSKYHRYFCYLSLFGFSMLGLVISNSLLFMFIFWELVGLCSYFLIGFYFDKKFASNAAIKAFVTNRVGDLGFLVGLMLVFFYLNTFDLRGAADTFRAQYTSNTALFTTSVWGVSLATWMGIGLFCGAVGKSAQFPLHVWLPDAMAGPTPVSALIHAATMVAAGVYLVARIFLLLTPEALMVIAWIGAITLTITALVAIVQNDIKKVLAYSTLSQLGYMIFGMGMGAWISALFHLLTHAFFKALMFLCSGQVIEGCHHEQDIRKMGGLRHKMPVTAWTFLVGVLAIAGFGIPGMHIGLGGYFSKDEILAVAYSRTHNVHVGHSDEHGGGHANETPAATVADPTTLEGPKPATVMLARYASDAQNHGEGDHAAGTDSRTNHAQDANGDAESAGHGEDHVSMSHAGDWTDQRVAALPKHNKWLWFLPVLIAYVTPFYMMRCWWLTFMGKPRDQHVHDHAHETKLMYIPLIVLAIGTVYCGFFLFRPLVADMAPTGFLVPSIDGKDDAIVHDAHSALIWQVGFAFVVGFAIAMFIYRNGLGLADRIKNLPFVRPIHMVLERKYFIDDIYNGVFVGGTILVAQICRLVDTYIIDLFVNLTARLTERLAAASGWILDSRGLLGEMLARYYGRLVVWLISLLGIGLLALFIIRGETNDAIITAIALVVAFGIDGMVNGLATGAYDVAGAVRTPQVGRVRNYIMFAAGGAALLLAVVVYMALTSKPPGL